MSKRNFTPFPLLTTERLRLRQPEPADAPSIFRLRSDADVNKYLDRDPCQSLNQAEAFIQKVVENAANNISLYWAIRLKDSPDLTGTICLFGFSDETAQCEIGYELLPGYQGRGIMQEAAAKVIDYAFHVLKIQKIEAFFHRDNQRSANLLEGLGFRNAVVKDAENPDLLCYYLLSSV